MQPDPEMKSNDKRSILSWFGVENEDLVGLRHVTVESKIPCVMLEFEDVDSAKAASLMRYQDALEMESPVLTLNIPPAHFEDWGDFVGARAAKFLIEYAGCLRTHPFSEEGARKDTHTFSRLHNWSRCFGNFATAYPLWYPPSFSGDESLGWHFIPETNLLDYSGFVFNSVRYASLPDQLLRIMKQCPIYLDKSFGNRGPAQPFQMKICVVMCQRFHRRVTS
jgi:hypothetical protein